MAQQNINYIKGNPLNGIYLQKFIRNQYTDGIIETGQSAHAWMVYINESNNQFEKEGTGHMINDTHKTEMAYLGDPTILGQIQSSTAESGGLVKLVFNQASKNSFREGDTIDTSWGGNQALVVETGQGYIKVGTAYGFTAPVAGDYTVGEIVYQRTRNIAISGTQSPVGLTPVPDTIFNYFDILDDANQTNLFTSMINTTFPGREKEGFFTDGNVRQMLQRYFTNITHREWTSRQVNPENNAFTKTSSAGILQQIENAGGTMTMNVAPTKASFETMLRNWLIANPTADPSKLAIMTGAIGLAEIGEWYKELIKYDYNIALTFTDTDGKGINGLNATKIYIAGFPPINVIHWTMLDANGMGAKSTMPGFTQLPKTSGSFYFMNFTPVEYRDGRRGPAFQKVYLRHRHFFSFQKGLTADNGIGAILDNAQGVSMENMQMTSNDRDFNNLRVYGICMTNVKNPYGQFIAKNNV